MQYGVINYNHHAIPYILMTYLSYNGKFVPFDLLHPGPITSWQIDEETMETVRDFILGGSKITAVGDFNYEIKRCFLLGRKDVTNLDRILKNRDITLPTKIRLVKAVDFPSSHVWM